jgi:serine/threonine-protein kinase HipA
MTARDLPEKIKQLDVLVGKDVVGSLVKDSIYNFSYAEDAPDKADVGLFMPRTSLSYQDAALFPVMDQNLPEGYLFQRIREMFPKQALTPMHLLALAGANGIGRLGFVQKGQPPSQMQTVSREQLLHARPDEGLFDTLVHAYLGVGTGIAGMQPKIMVPERATVPVPNLIVKTGSAAYPGLAANEFLCLTAAKKAGIDVPAFELSDDGSMVILDRFDLLDDGTRLGFEDVAAMMGLQVHDKLSDRKYHGSYEMIAEVLRTINLPAADLEAFFAQVAFSAMVRNGDGHLKNFGVLYTSAADVRLSPMFDVITTSIYQYERYPGGPSMEDNTMALKLFRGKRSQTKTYPLTSELVQFGTQACGVTRPLEVLERIAQAMLETREKYKTDARIPKGLIAQMGAAWDKGMPSRVR